VYPHNASNDEKKIIYQRNKSKYEELLREGKQIEEAANAAAAFNERKRSDSEVLDEMVSKLNTNSDKQNGNSDNDESETKMVT